MKLSALRIENHSRLRDASVEVRDHLVLVGPNDVGKSSLLRCLDFALGASTAQLYARLGVVDLRNPDLPFTVEVDLHKFTDKDKALFPDEITVDTSSGATSLTIRLEVIVDANETLSISRTAPGGGTGRQVSRDQLVALGWRIIGANASARDLRDDRSASLDDILRSIELGDERADFSELAGRLQEKLAGSQVLDGVRDQLAGQLSRALPSRVAKSDLSFVSGASATSDVLSDVRLQIAREGSWRNLSEQSDGTRALFAIALYDLVSSSANIVAIDEPEIHLHPASQRSLARLLRAGNQKILATHSVDIVGAFPPECIVAIKAGGELVQPVAGLLSRDERMAVRWWVRDKLEPLTAAWVVGVEGISDRIILEQAARVTGRELDRLGVSVVETAGSGDVAAILKLFGREGFRSTMSLLIDADAAAGTALKLAVSEADLSSNSIWVSQPDLEAEYVSAIGSGPLWTAIEASGLFSTNELRRCRHSGPRATISENDVAEFCRSKSDYKVRAAMIAASQLTETTARAINSIECLLDDLAMRV